MPSRNQVTFCVFGTGFGPVNENDCDAPSASVSDAAAGTRASMGSVLSYTLHTSASLQTGQYVTPSTRIKQFSQGRKFPVEYTAPSNAPTALSKPAPSGVGTGVLAEIQTFHFTCDRCEKIVALGSMNSTVDGGFTSSYSSARP